MKLLIFSGSAREGNYTQVVASFLETVINNQGVFSASVVDPLSVGFTLAEEGNRQKETAFKKQVVQADAFIFVSPEYNHSYSASIKFIIDLNLPEYAHKPVGLVGVSSGSFGGARAVQALLPVVRHVGLVAVKSDANFSDIKSEVKEGKIVDEEKWTRRCKNMLDELSWMSEVLKAGREKKI